MARNARKQEEREETEVELSVRLNRLDIEIAALERRNKLRQGCPPGWGRVETEHPTRPRKVRVTLRLDKEVAGWFWQQGEGYQARINAVLRAYMLAKRVALA